mgnify:CR=1 FL=1
MIQTEDIVKLGELFSKRIIKIECNEYDKFMPGHEIEFKLVVLDMVYCMKVKPDHLTENQANQIWMDLFSSFLADYNLGLAKKAKITATP